MIPKRTNPPMPEQPLTRILRYGGFVEGEDFKVKCPNWCEPIAEGAFPTEEGWYLAVSRFAANEENKPEVEPVCVCHRPSSNTLVVHEAAAPPEQPAELRDFWWVGKIILPEVKDLRG